MAASAAFVLLCSALAPLRAEFRVIEMTMGNLECASCAESLPKRLKRVRGVESVELDSARGVVKLELAEGNRVRLEQIRDFIQQDGTKVTGARVRVHGVVSKEDSRWVLRPSGLSQTYDLDCTAEQQKRLSGDVLIDAEIAELRPATERTVMKVTGFPEMK